jgi:tRNA(Arg) A34 adenosine deaminase TadA
MARDDREHLRAAFEIARRARRHGNHPFGAVLVDSAGGRILEAENTVVTEHDSTGHAETNLMRAASHTLSGNALSRCTIYTSAEPCAMCAGAIYWANVRRVVFGLSQRELYVITGGEPHELALAMPCREVFARGAHEIEVEGPVLVDEAAAVHAGFWNGR